MFLLEFLFELSPLSLKFMTQIELALYVTKVFHSVNSSSLLIYSRSILSSNFHGLFDDHFLEFGDVWILLASSLLLLLDTESFDRETLSSS